jgi:hypothetical protein
MLKSHFTLLIPTIGIPEFFEALKTIANKTVQPDQIIVVIDDKGRSLSSLVGTMDDLERKIRELLPDCQIMHNTHDEDWQMNNQTFNIGMEAARHKYVFVTHDDVLYPDEPDFFASVGKTIPIIETGSFPKRVVGAVFPAYHTEIDLVAPSFESAGLTQYYSAVASLLNKDFWAEVGKFDIQHGIWWDAQMQGEFWAKDCWMYYSPVTPVTHYMNRALRATNHSQGWTRAPLWSNCAAAFEKVYGKPHILWGDWYNRPETFLKL